MSILSYYIDFWRQYDSLAKDWMTLKTFFAPINVYGCWTRDCIRSLETQNLARAVDVMKARAKRVHILMINANKTFFFFRSQNLLKIEWMISRTLILSKLLITRTKTIILSPISPTLRFFQRIFVSLEGSKNQDSTVAVYLHNVTQFWEEHFVTVQITAV